MNFPKFNSFWRYIVASICEIKHAPKCCIGIRLRYLEERKIWGIWRWEGELVYWRDDTSVGDGPLEITRCFATDNPRS